jgi:hypothetical protein
MSGRYGNEDDWLRGVLKFFKKSVDSPVNMWITGTLKKRKGLLRP